MKEPNHGWLSDGDEIWSTSQSKDPSQLRSPPPLVTASFRTENSWSSGASERLVAPVFEAHRLVLRGAAVLEESIVAPLFRFSGSCLKETQPSGIYYIHIEIQQDVQEGNRI